MQSKLYRINEREMRALPILASCNVIASISMKAIKVVKSIVATWIAIGSKGVLPLFTSVSLDRSLIGKALNETWSFRPENGTADRQMAIVRECHAKGIPVASKVPALSAFDHGKNCSEITEQPVLHTIGSALEAGLIKRVAFTATRDNKTENFFGYVLKKFDPAKGLSSSGATDNGCQFITCETPVFGLRYVETRKAGPKGVRNVATFVKLGVQGQKAIATSTKATPKNVAKSTKANAKAKGSKK